MIWIEFRKAVHSRLPLWLALGSLILPLGIAFLIFAARNPQITQQLGLVSAKADLVAYAGTDWPAYFSLSGQMAAMGVLFMGVLLISWIFGREFVDGTLKDWLAVPVWRGSILLAKFLVTAGWSAALALLLLLASLGLGGLMGLPGGSQAVILSGSLQMAVTGGLTILLVLPFALFASIGRGYLLPVGMLVLTLMLTNVVTVAGWGEFFPWAIAGLYAQGKSALGLASFLIVLATGLAGMAATYGWWMTADQSK